MIKQQQKSNKGLINLGRLFKIQKNSKTKSFEFLKFFVKILSKNTKSEQKMTENSFEQK